MRKHVDHLERHYRCHDLVPEGRYTYKGIDYVVAMGGPHEIHYPTTDTEIEIARDHPNGYYEFAVALLRDDQPWIGYSNVIDKYHDPMHTEEGRKEMRVKAAKQAAERMIDDGAKAVLEAEK